MRVGEIREVITEWVEEELAPLPGFLGAYLAGSIVGVPEDAPWPATSDVDLMIVSPPGVDLPAGKRRVQGILLEPTNLHSDRLATPEAVLGDYHLAGNLRTDTVLADPTGRLRGLQRQVQDGFPREAWVRRRCLHAHAKAADGLATLDPTAPLHQLVLSWVFPTGIMTHVPLVAALRNPTVRRRYPAAREVLAAYDLSAAYPPLLDLLGCANLSADRVARHMPGLAYLFDAAASVRAHPAVATLPFLGDIQPLARPIAIDGSAALIAAGDHREAVFWMVVTAARCCSILAVAAPEAVQARHAPTLRALLDDLGIPDSADILARARRATAHLPALWSLAEEIMARNEGIVRG